LSNRFEQHQEVDVAVQKGAEAAQSGKSEKANPYALDDSVHFGAWLAGWISGSSDGRTTRC